jgi:hypothetical protein
MRPTHSVAVGRSMKKFSNVSSARLLLFFSLHIGLARSWSGHTTTSLHIRVRSRIDRSHQGCAIRSTLSTRLVEKSVNRALFVQDVNLFDSDTPLVPVILTFAICLFAAAQTLINQQLQGEQGLGAYLRDGSGYSRSGFRPLASDRDRALSGNDPLPWLKLPTLDFVQVAGQSDVQTDAVMEDLEVLLVVLNEKLENGETEEAMVAQRKLESLMRANGIEYRAD